jgi:hypothetical protein
MRARFKLNEGLPDAFRVENRILFTLDLDFSDIRLCLRASLDTYANMM